MLEQEVEGAEGAGLAARGAGVPVSLL